MPRPVAGSPGPALPLDDVLDLLQGPEGRGFVREAKARLGAAVDFEGPAVVPKPGGGQPSDGFDRLTAHALTHSFLTQARSTAAVPNAMVYALAHAADADGMLTEESVASVFGGQASALYTLLAQRLDDGRRDVPTQRRRTKYQWLPDEVSELVARSKANASETVSRRMPVLAEVTRTLGSPDRLRNLSFAAVQHLFPTTEGLFDALTDNGLDPESTIIHGKNYSTNEDVYHRMRAKGWRIPNFALMALPSTGGPGHMNTAGAYLTELFEGVEPDPHPPEPRFLLLDEGGKMLKALHEHFPEYAPLCVAVEQTDRGIQVIEELETKGIELGCPVVSVARSAAKKTHESPMIGESVAHATLSALTDLHPDFPMPRSATIIGYGAVGKATADALRRRGFPVRVFDIDPERMAQAEADGCTTGSREEVLAQAELLISATGRTTLTPDEYDALLPDRAILVNAASGNHELGLHQVEGGPGFLTDDPKEHVDEEGFRRSEFGGLNLLLGDLAGDEQMYSRVIRGANGTERLALRSGYVVNMLDDIPPEYIQLTRSLLLAACLEAPKHHGEKGLVELAPEVQEFVVSRTARHLRTRGLDLAAPDFRRLAPAEP